MAPVSFMDGVQTQLPNYFKGENVLKTDSLSDYKDILKLLEGIPKYLQQIQILLQKGIENKLTFHKASMSRIKAQFEKLMDFGKIEDCIFYTPFQKLMGNSEAVENIKEEAKRTIHHKVIPAFEKLQSYLFDEYFMHLREFPGISSLDDDIYQAYLEYYTTIEGITPEEIHNIGLDEVAKLKSEMMTVVKNELGHNNMSFLELAEMLKDDTNQLFESKEEIIEYYQDVIQQAMGKIGQFFDEKVLNNDTYNINFKQVPPGGGGLAYYW